MKKIFLFSLALMASICMWAYDFSATEITTGGTTKDNITCTAIAGNGSGNTCTESGGSYTSGTVAKISNGGRDNYIEIKAAEGYKLVSPVNVQAVVDNNSDKAIVICYWEDDYDNTNGFAKYEVITWPNRKTACANTVKSLTFTGTIRTIRIYRQVYVNATTHLLGTSSGSGYSQVGGNTSFFVSEISATAESVSSVTHTLTWDFAGGSCSATAGTNYTAGGDVAEGATITYPANNTMSKDGYDFNGWSTSVTTMPTSDLTITAQWVEHTLSSDATLADLTVAGETVEGFDAATTEYNVELAFGTSAVPTVTGEANSAYAKSVVVTPATLLPGATTVVVTAEDNSTKTYTINFTVAESKVIDLVWKKDQSACAVAGSQAAVIKSDDSKVSTYIKQITFDQAEGEGDNAVEGGSLNTGKKEGNTIIIQTQSGFLFTAMSFFGKIESADEKCFISTDGGSNWTDLESTSANDATYCDVISDASTNDIRIKSNGAAGVWIRNMQLTIKKGSKTPTAITNTSAATKAQKRIENGQLVIEKNGQVFNAMGQTIR